MENESRAGRIQLIAVLFFLAFSIGVSQLLRISYQPAQSVDGQERTLSVEVWDIGIEDYPLQFTVTGVVESKASVSVVPQVSGRVVFVNPNFYKGGRFIAGETLFRIDPSDFDIALKQREADLQRARANLDLSEAEVISAKQNWRQVNGNSPIPPLVGKEPQLLKARAELASAEAALSAAKLQRERADFTLPFAGRVVSSEVSLGQFISAGQGYGVVYDSDSLEVSTSLDQQKLRWLQLAEKPSVTIQWLLDGQTQLEKGNVPRSAAVFDENTRFANVNFGFDNIPKQLISGVFVDVKVQASTLRNVMKVPTSALQTDGALWLVDNNRLSRWQPEILFQTDEYIVVQALEAPVQIVVSRIAGGIDGVEVVVRSKIDNEPEANAQ